METKRYIGGNPARARIAILRAAAVVIVLGMATLALLSGCDNAYGVFASVQLETKQIGTDVFENVMVKAVTGDGTRYYAQQGSKIHSRAAASTTWTVLPVGPSQTSSYFAAGMAFDGARLWVVASDPSTLVLSGIHTTADQGSTWTTIADPGLASGELAQGLLAANGTVFLLSRVSSGSANAYTLREYLPSSASWASRLSGLASPISDLAWDGSAFWAAAGSSIYTGATGAALAADGSAPAGKTFSGLSTYGSALYVACSDGTAYARSGGVWGSAVTIASSIAIGTMVSVPVSASAERLLIARHDSSYGYYEYDGSTVTAGSAGLVTLTESNYSTTVYAKAVNAFYYHRINANSGTLFAALNPGYSSGYGLYSTRWNGTAWSGWTAE